MSHSFPQTSVTNLPLISSLDFIYSLKSKLVTTPFNQEFLITKAVGVYVNLKSSPHCAAKYGIISPQPSQALLTTL